jgi:hypothetical protein
MITNVNVDVNVTVNGPQRDGQPSTSNKTPTVPGVCGRVSWELPNMPMGGWGEITFPFTVRTAPDASGWHFTQQFGFVGGSTGYCGVQPRPAGRQLAVFSVRGQGASVVDVGRCQSGADGGPGVSCWALAPLVRGREYLLTVHRFEQGSRVWRGLLADGDTGQQWELGSWRLSHNGGINPSQVGFMEYYKPVADCTSTPLAILHFGAPYNAPSGITGRCHSPVHYGRCKDRLDYAAKSTKDGQVWMRSGWPSPRHEPASSRPKVNVTVKVSMQ